MDETTRKLMEQVMREKRLREQLLGSTSSIADVMKKLELSNAALGGSISQVLRNSGLDKDSGWLQSRMGNRSRAVPRIVDIPCNGSYQTSDDRWSSTVWIG